MNREQRRAALRQSKKVTGFDTTQDTLEVSVAGSDEKLVVDTFDMGVIFAIHDLVYNFADIETTYKEDYEKAFAPNGDIEAKYQLMKKVVTDFSESVENIFGEDSAKKIFGHKYPHPVQISEFIEDFTPVAQAIFAAFNLSEDDFKAEAAATSNITPIA